MPRASLIALALLLAAPSVEIQGGYSTEPLARAVFPPEHVAVDAVAFDAWLNANHGSLEGEALKGPREHLYYLIDSQVKAIYARDHVVLPKQPDAVLALLFAWSERLGVFGGRLVHDAVKSPEAPAAPAASSVPPGFGLALERDMLVLTSESGHWSVSVPYYFMIWSLGEREQSGAPTTQVVALSTGAARHEGQDGHSQATLMLLFGPGADPGAFAPFWARRLGFGGDEPWQPLEVRALKSRKSHDADGKLHREYTTWSSPRGQFVVAYLGLNGTYQWNRPHFVDFVKSIRER